VPEARQDDEAMVSLRTFRDWWKQHDVAWPHSWRKELKLPNGIMVYNTFDLTLLRPMRLRIISYIPAIED